MNLKDPLSIQCVTLSTGTVRDYPANMAHPVELKVVLVGPPGSGKSSMILALTSNSFKTVHSPTTFDNKTLFKVTVIIQLEGFLELKDMNTVKMTFYIVLFVSFNITCDIQ